MNAVQALADVFGRWEIIGSISLAISLTAVWFIVHGWLLQKQVKRDAIEAINVLSDGDKSSLIASLDGLASSKLRDRLREEVEHVTSVGGQTFRVTNDPESFVDILWRYFNVRQFDAVPNIFIGVGLLLTFLGLALSLWSASNGAASGDIAVVKQSVTKLLEFSAAKFVFSLGALFWSIVLGTVRRSQRHAMEVALRSVDRNLDRRFPIVTSERLLLVQMSEEFRANDRQKMAEAGVTAAIAAPAMQLFLQHIEQQLEQAKDQTAELQRFNSDLAVQLGKALDDRLQPMLQSLADRVEGALRDMGGSIGGSYDRAFQDMLSTFLTELRAATKTDAEAMRLSMQQLAADLGSASRDLTERMDGVFSGLESFGDRFAGTLTQAGSSLQSDIGAAQRSMLSNLGEAIGMLRQTSERSASASESLAAKLSDGALAFRSTVESGALTFVGEMDRGARSIEQVVERLGTSVTALHAVISRAESLAGSASERTSERLSQLGNSISELDAGFRRMREASEPFGHAADQVRRSLELLNTTQIAVQAKVNSLESAATAIQAGSQSLRTTLEEQVDRLTRGLGSSTNEMTSAISRIASEAEHSGSRLQDAIGETLGEYQKRFSGIDRELGGALQQMIGTFTNTYEQIRERVHEIDSQFAQSVEKLVAFNDKFEETANDLADQIGTVAKQSRRRDVA